MPMSQAAERPHCFTMCQPRPSLTARTNASRVRNFAQTTTKLTETEELALVQWILSMDERGYPPRICAVGKAAELLLKQRAAGPSASIGVN